MVTRQVQRAPATLSASRWNGGGVRRHVGIALLAVLAWAALVGRAEAQLGALLSPGPLAKAHSALEGISNCQKCHAQGRRVTAEKCLACHSPVADRIARKVGVHKNVTVQCVSCHSDHGGVDGELRPFDQKAFDHAAVASFPLTGKHATAGEKCAACHKERSFLTLRSSCVSCHADIHKGRLGQSCASCHSTQTAFKELSGEFNHAAAGFQLVGAHKKVACAGCHVNNMFRGIKSAACIDCHRDPHVQKLGAACASCHSFDVWRTRRVDHAKTAFPLVARHATVECAACHKQPALKVKVRAETCGACHADIHRGTFRQDCKACHSESGWGKAPFDHAQTRFLLAGKHQSLVCEKCHTTISLSSRVAASRVADYRGLMTTCVSCHRDVHQSELGLACESCHSSTTFRLPTFAHQRFPEFFAGEHASVACDRCHAPAPLTGPLRTGAEGLKVKFTSTKTACVSCHRDVHLGQEGAVCETCHTVHTPKFALPDFAHNTKTTYVLTGRHQSVTCTACHKVESGAFPSATGTATRWKGVAKECRSCHKDVHLGQLAAACESCHVTSTFKIPIYSHRQAKATAGFFVGSHTRAACAACHQASTRKFPAGVGTAVQFRVDAGCVACHRDIHRGSLGSDCGRCHRP